MKPRVRKFRIAILFGVFSLSLLPSLAAQGRHDGTCPVMPGTRVNPHFYVDYKGERVFFCCRSCVKAFKKHPQKYWVPAG